MFSEFVLKKLKQARYKILKDGNYFAKIPGMRGVWASAKNLEDCRKELREVLEDWILLKIKGGDTVPGFTFRTDRRTLVRNA